MDDPRILYARTLIAVRLDALRDNEKKTVGASAIEWAVITGLLAFIAFVCYVAIKAVITDAVGDAQVRVNQGPGAP